MVLVLIFFFFSCRGYLFRPIPKCIFSNLKTNFGTDFEVIEVIKPNFVVDFEIIKVLYYEKIIEVPY